MRIGPTELASVILGGERDGYEEYGRMEILKQKPDGGGYGGQRTRRRHVGSGCAVGGWTDGQDVSRHR